jgi:hypothetical protein
MSASASYPIIDSIRGIVADFTTGEGVAYAALAGSEAYRAYQREVAGLSAFRLERLAQDGEKKAFWINLYNALLIDSVIREQIRRSVQEAHGLFSRIGCMIGGHWFSADDIEHGILRRNSRHPARLRPPFSTADPRLPYRVDHLDPRIHFALNCAARSCPPIRFYEAEKIDAQLDLATRAALAGGMCVLNRQALTLSLSRIFMWYASDFGAGLLGLFHRHPLVDFTARYLPADDQAFVRENSRRLKVRFQAYDWGLNQNE